MHEFISALTPITVSAVILAIVLAATRLAPFTKPYWSYLPKKLQTWLPSIIAGLPIAVSAFGSVKTWLDFLQALLVVGAVPAALAVPGASSPHNHPELPPPAGTEGIVDHNKDEPPPPPPVWPSAAVLLLAIGFAFNVNACALFGSKGSAWPALGACAPTGETLFSEVESVLTSSGGSYEDDLLALGKTEGLSFVECAVKSVVDALSNRIAARVPGARITPDEGIGVARGKAFLAKVEEAHK